MWCLPFSRRRFPILVCIAIIGLETRRSAAQDTAVILGGGQVGTWSTAGFVANTSNGAIRLNVVPFEGACIAECIPPEVHLSAYSSLSLDYMLAATTDASKTFETFYLEVFPPMGSPPGSIASVPEIGARFVDQSHPGRSVDIPVILLSRLEATNPSTLSFGGVTLQRGGPGRSNLVLGNVARSGTNVGEDLFVTLDLLGADGLFVGTTTLTIPYRGTVLIGDVVTRLGGGEMTLGQLIVERIGGNALMWGILYTVDANGAVASTPGISLSP